MTLENFACPEILPHLKAHAQFLVSEINRARAYVMIGVLIINRNNTALLQIHEAFRPLIIYNYKVKYEGY